MRKFLLLSFIVVLSLGCKEENKVVISTEYGEMTVQLFDSTPKHKKNFLKLTKSGFYDGLLFHRVINGFMIQGGDAESRNAKQGVVLGGGDIGYTIDAEIGIPHFKGMLAAARKADNVNPSKASSGSQFYIVQGRRMSKEILDLMENQKGIKYSAAQRDKYIRLGGAPDLDQEYTVFGEVIEGLDVIDKIAAASTDPQDRPLKNIPMKIRVAKQ